MVLDALPESSRNDRATSGPKCSPAERRKRREEVALALLGGRLSQTVKAEIATKWGISTRMVQLDISFIERQWARDDRKSIEQQRALVLRRLRSHSERLAERGDVAEAALVDYRIARLLGMGNKLEVAVGVKGHVVHVHKPADPVAWATQVLECAVQLEIVTPAMLALHEAATRQPADSQPTRS